MTIPAKRSADTAGQAADEGRTTGLALRQRAEEALRGLAVQSPEAGETLSPKAIRQTLHELRAHQIELEMQNEELRRAQLELDALRARYFDLYDLAPVGYCTVSERALIIEANLTAATLLGVARNALLKQAISRFIVSADQDIFYLHRKLLLESAEPRACELRMIRPDGAHFWARLQAIAALDVDGAGALRIVISDISERKISEAKIEALAFFDSLTHLPNRTLLRDRLQQVMTSGHRYGTFAALLFIDLDHFKALNDSQGHGQGDLLLRTVAQRIGACIRESDTVARLGGDEFVVLLGNLIGDRQAAGAETAIVGEKIRAALEQPYPLGELDYRSSASIGASLFRGHETAMDDLFKQADLAMYEAKKAGRNRVCFFAPAG